MRSLVRDVSVYVCYMEHLSLKSFLPFVRIDNLTARLFTNEYVCSCRRWYTTPPKFTYCLLQCRLVMTARTLQVTIRLAAGLVFVGPASSEKWKLHLHNNT